MFYEDVLRALQKHGVRYLIVGGAAVNLHGVPRMTGDLDLAIDMSESNIAALVDALEESGLKSSIPVDPRGLADESVRRIWREERNLKALNFQRSVQGAPYREVDILLAIPRDFDEMYASRLELVAGDLTISAISISDLIRIKEAIGRQQDLADIEALRKAEAEQEMET